MRDESRTEGRAISATKGRWVVLSVILPLAAQGHDPPFPINMTSADMMSKVSGACSGQAPFDELECGFTELSLTMLEAGTCQVANRTLWIHLSRVGKTETWSNAETIDGCGGRSVVTLKRERHGFSLAKTVTPGTKKTDPYCETRKVSKNHQWSSDASMAKIPLGDCRAIFLDPCPPKMTP